MRGAAERHVAPVDSGAENVARRQSPRAEAIGQRLLHERCVLFLLRAARIKNRKSPRYATIEGYCPFLGFYQRYVN
jgi:hypothetical protein